MIRETTPATITPDIKRICSLVSENEPLYVSIHPAPGMSPQNCFPNVASLVEQVGGN